MCRVAGAVARVVKPHGPGVAMPCHAVAPDVASADVRVWHFSSLTRDHQQHLRRLRRLTTSMTESTNGEKTFVACSVVGRQHLFGCPSSSNSLVDNAFCATGVNYALHRAFNNGKTLKGILKGCAEQNALGAAAASGHRYTSINDVYLCAATRVTSREGTYGLGEDECCHGAAFPCAQCWSNLTTVAAMRRDEGVVEPLKLFLYAQTEATATCSADAAKRNLASCPLSSIDITVVIPG